MLTLTLTFHSNPNPDTNQVRQQCAQLLRKCGGGRLVCLVPNSAGAGGGSGHESSAGDGGDGDGDGGDGGDGGSGGSGVAAAGRWHLLRALVHTRHWDNREGSANQVPALPPPPQATGGGGGDGSGGDGGGSGDGAAACIVLDGDFADAAVLQLLSALPEDPAAFAAVMPAALVIAAAGILAAVGGGAAPALVDGWLCTAPAALSLAGVGAEGGGDGGSPATLATPLATPLATALALLAPLAAPLTPPPRGLALGSSAALLPGLTRLRVFGYPQAVDGTPTPTDGTYAGVWEEAGTGRWLKLQGLVMPGHSGGPCLDEAGAVVAWNVRNRLSHDQAGLNHMRPIEEGAACLRAARELLSSEELLLQMGSATLVD